MKTILTALTCYLVMLTACLAAGDRISIETIGAVRFVDGKESYGAGLSASLRANRFVAVTGRALAYRDEVCDNGGWRGPAIDEIGAGVQATLFRYGRLSLAAVAGANYAFGVDDIGISAGGRAVVDVYGPTYLFVQYEREFWDKRDSNNLGLAGIGVKF